MTDEQDFVRAFYEEEYKQAMELVAEIAEFRSLRAEKPSELDIKKERLGSARSRLDEIIKVLTADTSVPRQMIEEIRECRDAAELVGPPVEFPSPSAPSAGPSQHSAVLVQIQLSCVKSEQEPASESVSSARAEVESPPLSDPAPASAPAAPVEPEQRSTESPELTVAHTEPIPAPASTAQVDQSQAAAAVKPAQAPMATSGKARRDLMTPVIEAAQRECKDPFDNYEVWPVLVRMCKEGRAPMREQTEGGIKWVDGDDKIRFFSIKNLRDRLSREQKRLAETR